MKPTRSLTPRFLPCPSPHSPHPTPPTPRRLLKVEHVEEDGKAMLYLVFEYLDQDLKNYMDAGPALPTPAQGRGAGLRCISFAPGARTCRHGVTHCDLKPQNLLVDKAKNVIRPDPPTPPAGR